MIYSTNSFFSIGRQTNLQAPTWVGRFWSRVNKTPTCWLWTGPVLNSGYGVVYGPGEIDSTPAHRVSWLLAHGPIPPGRMHICHTCDVRLCVNPEHLFLGTARDNIHDMMAKGRMVCRQPRAATCHPERRNRAKGLCNACYKRHWKQHGGDSKYWAKRRACVS